jgi:hypothetical protein
MRCLPDTKTFRHLKISGEDARGQTGCSLRIHPAAAESREGVKMKIVFRTAQMILAFCTSLAPQSFPAQAQQPEAANFDSNLMEATFRLEGQGLQGSGQTVNATGFLLGRPYAKDQTKGRYVLVTAAHVFDEMRGDTIIVHSRRKVGSVTWVEAPFPVAIRANGRPLFIRLPDADVAVMYLQLPSGVTPPLLPTTILADDEILKRFAVHPGDQVRCLGYPLGLQSNQAGFPILRSGEIASFPLLPTESTKTFLLDFKVFKGNSGGPAYLIDSSRDYGGTVHIGETVHFIVGLVSQEALVEQKISSPYSEEVRELQLNLGIIVHASQIKKAIDLLPPPEDASPGTPGSI